MALPLLFLGVHVAAAQGLSSEAIPLPEHPRPDFERSEWVNLNGPWAFRFDSVDVGVQEGWYDGETDFFRTITVPRAVLEKAAATGEVIIRLDVDDALPCGLAIYGACFGRYPLDPTLVFVMHGREAMRD